MEDIEVMRLLKSQNITEVEMDMMWYYCLEHGHKIVKKFHNFGRGWKHLNYKAALTLKEEYDKKGKRKSMENSTLA